MPDVREEKKALRAQIKEERLQITPEQHDEWDKQILTRLLTLEEYRRAQLILLYISTPDEAGTDGIIEAANRDGKIAASPYCIRDCRGLDFYAIRGREDTRLGAYDIPEPDITRTQKIERFDNALVIVPAMCFDEHNYRLGYGGGYYDRFLEKFTGANVGIIYSRFIRKQVPRDRYDKAVDVLVTEQDIRRRPR